jgi:hypothetical protein
MKKEFALPLKLPCSDLLLQRNFADCIPVKAGVEQISYLGWGIKQVLETPFDQQGHRSTKTIYFVCLQDVDVSI